MRTTWSFYSAGQLVFGPGSVRQAGELVALDERTPLDTPLFWQYHRVGSRALEPLTVSVRRAARSILLQED